MSRHTGAWTARRALASLCLGSVLALTGGCASDGYDNVSTSMSVGVGYGSYYGPGWYGGYYEPYPPVVVVPPAPGDRPERPNGGGNRPTTLPADAGGPSTRPAGMSSSRPSTAPSRPTSSSRPTSRPSPRPAPRPMPRMGRR